MPGPPPKPMSLRQRRNKKSTKATLQTPSKVDEIPALPEMGDEFEWHSLALAWWEHVWQSPMASEYLQTDVDGLGRLAILVDSFYKSHSVAVMTEMRLQEARFGLSPIDRSRLQWTVAKADEETDRAQRRKSHGPSSTAKDPRSVLQVVK